MDAVHLHLWMNHLPVVGTVVAIALLAFALLRRSPELVRVSLGMFVVLAVLGGIVFLTGEPAEELVEKLPGISEALVEEHEETAKLATILLAALGLFALGGLVAFRRRAGGIPRGFAAAALLLAVVPAAFMGYAANLGGQIRHPEIRPGGVAAAAGGEQAARHAEPTSGGEAEHDRD